MPKKHLPKRRRITAVSRRPTVFPALRDPAADPINEFLSRDDFAAGPPAPGAPTRKPKRREHCRKIGFDTGRLWTDLPEE